MTTADVSAFAAWRRSQFSHLKRPVGPARTNRDLAHFKTLFGWLVRTKRLRENPTKDVRQAREFGNTRQIVIIEKEPFEKLVSHLEEHWRVACEALVATGMRWSSLRKLRPEHLNEARRVVRLVRPKGKVDVELGIASERGWAALKAVAGNAFYAADVGGFNKALGIACEEAGIPRVTAHMFRHTAAVRWLRAGADIRQVQLWLAHADITTTQKYLRFVKPETPPALI